MPGGPRVCVGEASGVSGSPDFPACLRVVALSCLLAPLTPFFVPFLLCLLFLLALRLPRRRAGWLRSRHDSFCRGPGLGLFLFFKALFLRPFFCPLCGFCCLHGGGLTVCCFFFLCVSSASTIWASRLWWTGFSRSQACNWGNQCSTASCDTLSAFALVGASRCASPLLLSGFVADGLRPAPAAAFSGNSGFGVEGTSSGEKEGDVQTGYIEYSDASSV